MSLIEEEPRHPVRTLLLVGCPSFLLAIVLSFASHEFVHLLVNKAACVPTAETTAVFSLGDTTEPHTTCALSSALGTIWTFALAIVFFSLYLRHPRNLFIGAMAFVNASMRIPESFTVFLQLLFNTRTRLQVDEYRSLALLGLKDPTISVLLMCFFSLTVLFLTITIVHDTKTVPWKWGVAFVLFILLGPIQNFLWSYVAPAIS
ncbi:MAG TPA: hypothetical protein VLY03_11065 [Bacteroidota bacterium]|nr:hypothetical protein [Bacteroidota bacterium]